MSDWVTLKNALDLSLRPIDVWPGKLRADRDRSPYSAPLKDTLATLKREMFGLSARKIVLQIALREQDLRLDGLPRAGAIATHPGIILAFDSKHGPLRLFFDRFTRWDHNLRAVAVHLEHLRLAGLYGVGTDGQQYKGWLALPAPEPDDFATAEAAAEFIARAAGVAPSLAGEILSDSETRAYYYRIAAKIAHPDVGGDHDQFIRLKTAQSMLDGERKRTER